MSVAESKIAGRENRIAGWRAAALVLVLLALAAPASADLQAGNGEIGVEIGFTELNFVDDSNEVRWGIRGGYLFNRVFELEGQLWSTSGDVSDVGQVAGDVTFTSFFVNAVFNTHFQERRTIVPYGLIGAGYLDANVDTENVGFDDSSLAFQVGLGSRFFFGKGSNLALRAEISALLENTFSTHTEHLSFSVGLMWRIRGGR